MSEEQRLISQRHYLEICRSRQWLDDDNKHLWPDDDDARAKMARELLGLALTHGFDSAFFHASESLPTVPGLEALTESQRDALLREYDRLLDFAMYQFCITLDRFDHGVLEIRHGIPNDEGELQSPVTIQPLRSEIEMFQDALRWKDEFGQQRFKDQ